MFKFRHWLLLAAHILGKLLGWVLYHTAPRWREIASTRLLQSGLATQNTLKPMLKQNFSALGQAICEAPVIWSAPSKSVAEWMVTDADLALVEQARAAGKGAIFLTPHLGCFEITSRYLALFIPITIMYRPPKQAWLEPMINRGRLDHNITLAAANMHGVKLLMNALKRGEAIGVLPDQIPHEGEGEWASFFDKPAYTMTLVSKLAQKSGAAVFMMFGERLPHGRYRFNLTRLPDGMIHTTEGLNRAIEQEVAKCPTQYLWTYNRHKVSRKHKPQLEKLP